MSQNPNNSTSRDELVAEGRALFDKHVLPERERRRAELHQILNELPIRPDDPRMVRAYPLADTGVDKVFAEWSPQDILAEADFIERGLDAETDAEITAKLAGGLDDPIEIEYRLVDDAGNLKTRIERVKLGAATVEDFHQAAATMLQHNLMAEAKGAERAAVLLGRTGFDTFNKWAAARSKAHS